VSKYSIKDLERLSGIKAHTIRIWEQRYRLIKPHRTHSNIRYYDESELKRLLDIALLNKNGYKISKIATFCEHCISHLLSGIATNESDIGQHDELMIIMVTMDEEKFHSTIDSKIKENGFIHVLEYMIVPFLEKINFIRLTGTINTVHENFIINLIRQKIVAATDKIKRKQSGKPGFLLFLPEGESHELILLIMQFLLRSKAYKTYYLGQNTSLYDVEQAYKLVKPDYIYTILSERFTGQPIGSYIDELNRCCPQSVLLLSGYQLNVLNIPSGNKFKTLNSFAEAISFLDELSKNSISK